MSICKTFARLIAMYGGLEALAGAPVWVFPDGREPLRIELLGDGPNGAATRLVSVAEFIERDGEDWLTHPEMIFEVDPGDDRKRGWASGRWRPLAYHNAAHDLHIDATTYRGHVVELKQFARQWDGRIAQEGYVEEFATFLRGAAILEREQAERREKRRAKRRADREPRRELRVLTLPA